MTPPFEPMLIEWVYRKRADGSWWCAHLDRHGFPWLAVGPVTDAERMDNPAMYIARKYPASLMQQALNAERLRVPLPQAQVSA